MRNPLRLAGTCLLLALAAPALAADPAAAKAKAAQCAACHGADGMAVLPGAPNLANQNEEYLVKALKDYRSGARKNEQMNVMAKGLSDKDIENLAAYFHQMPPGGKDSSGASSSKKK